MSLSPNDTQPPYVYQAWPAWFYGPEGQSAVFNGPDEVPIDWTDIPPGTSRPGEEVAEDAPPAEPIENLIPTPEAPAIVAPEPPTEQEPPEPAAEPELETEDGGFVHEDTEEEKTAKRAAIIQKLHDESGHKELLDMLDDMVKIDPNIEFARNWGKLKLATTIVDNGGPLEN